MDASANIPRSNFGKRSTAEEVTAGCDLSGKTIVVTGSTSGIGHEAMRVFALRGANVIAVGRTKEKAAACVAALGTGFSGKITPVGCDHGDLASVAACADAIRALTPRIDILVCNAGLIGSTKCEQINGIEKQFLVNHLSHFVLVNRLLDLVRAAPQGRVVVVSSDAHHSAPKEGILFDNLSGAKDYGAFRFYSHSKLANHLFTHELARRLQGTTTTVNSLHPGVVFTNIFNNMPAFLRGPTRALGRLFMKDVAAGAATTCYLATAPALDGVSGGYFADCNPAVMGRHMTDDAMASRLWTVSEDLTRPYLA